MAAAREPEAQASRAGATRLGREPAAGSAERPPRCRLGLCGAELRLRPGPGRGRGTRPAGSSAARPVDETAAAAAMDALEEESFALSLLPLMQNLMLWLDI